MLSISRIEKVPTHKDINEKSNKYIKIKIKLLINSKRKKKKLKGVLPE